MFHPTTLATLFVAAALTVGCGDDTPTTPTDTPPPAAITEEFPGSLNPNGGRTHQFDVQTTGSVQASLTALAPDSEAVIGLSLGTWNGQVCQIILANDNATQGTTITGSANGTGRFCVRLYDVGNLTGNVDYTVTVIHF